MGVADIAHDVLGEVVLKARRVGGLAVVFLRVVVVYETEREHGGNGRTTGCDGLVVDQGAVLLVVGVAAAQRERETVVDVQGALGKGRHGLGLLLKGGEVGAVVRRVPEENAAEAALAAPDDLVLEFDLFLGVIGTHGPLEAARDAIGIPGETQFLRQQRDLGQVLVRQQRIDPGEVVVLEVAVLVIAPGADRGERRGAEVPVDLRRQPFVFGLQARIDVQVDLVVLDVGRINDLRADGACDGAIEGSRTRIVLVAQRGAAGLVEFGVVGDHADAEIVGGHQQQLATQAVAVEIGDLLARHHVVEPAVALGP